MDAKEALKRTECKLLLLLLLSGIVLFVVHHSGLAALFTPADTAERGPQ
nr:hypothetical protein [Scandinavium goeteborgense]